MQFSNFLKVAAVALPLMAVTACSSNKTTTDEGGTTTVNASQKILEQVRKLQQINIVYFDFDKYNVKQEYATLLDAHAVFMRANSGIKVVIEGHADERGTPEYNIALGERRANAVKSYLQGNGVPGG